MDPRIKIVSSILENDLSRTLRLPDLSHSVSLSSSRLRHLFRTETGRTIGQYRKDARLDRAQMLLRTTLRSVKEIMHRVGISSDTHFARDFKETCGLSPTHYRARSQESPSIDGVFSVLASWDKE
jgi:AraC family transcriptional regulator of arabinose operon